MFEQKLGKLMKDAEGEKNTLIRTQENIGELSEKINGFMKKFDELKETMQENNKKFTAYQEEIETKKVTIQALEVENHNLLEQKSREQNKA